MSTLYLDDDPVTKTQILNLRNRFAKPKILRNTKRLERQVLKETEKKKKGEEFILIHDHTTISPVPTLNVQVMVGVPQILGSGEFFKEPEEKKPHFVEEREKMPALLDLDDPKTAEVLGQFRPIKHKGSATVEERQPKKCKPRKKKARETAKSNEKKAIPTLSTDIAAELAKLYEHLQNSYFDPSKPVQMCRFGCANTRGNRKSIGKNDFAVSLEIHLREFHEEHFSALLTKLNLKLLIALNNYKAPVISPQNCDLLRMKSPEKSQPPPPWCQISCQVPSQEKRLREKFYDPKRQVFLCECFALIKDRNEFCWHLKHFHPGLFSSVMDTSPSDIPANENRKRKIDSAPCSSAITVEDSTADLDFKISTKEEDNFEESAEVKDSDAVHGIPGETGEHYFMSLEESLKEEEKVIEFPVIAVGVKAEEFMSEFD